MQVSHPEGHSAGGCEFPVSVYPWFTCCHLTNSIIKHIAVITSYAACSWGALVAIRNAAQALSLTHIVPLIACETSSRVARQTIAHLATDAFAMGKEGSSWTFASLNTGVIVLGIQAYDFITPLPIAN